MFYNWCYVENNNIVTKYWKNMRVTKFASAIVPLYDKFHMTQVPS